MTYFAKSGRVKTFKRISAWRLSTMLPIGILTTTWLTQATQTGQRFLEPLSLGFTLCSIKGYSLVKTCLLDIYSLYIGSSTRVTFRPSISIISNKMFLQVMCHQPHSQPNSICREPTIRMGTIWPRFQQPRLHPGLNHRDLITMTDDDPFFGF
jgi:hypothetical protein